MNSTIICNYIEDNDHDDVITLWDNEEYFSFNTRDYIDLNAEPEKFLALVEDHDDFVYGVEIKI